MTEGEEKALRGTIENLLETAADQAGSITLLSQAMMKLIGRVEDLERIERATRQKPKSKLVGLNGHPMNG